MKLLNRNQAQIVLNTILNTERFKERHGYGYIGLEMDGHRDDNGDCLFAYIYMGRTCDYNDFDAVLGYYVTNVRCVYLSSSSMPHGIYLAFQILDPNHD